MPSYDICGGELRLHDMSAADNMSQSCFSASALKRFLTQKAKIQQGAKTLSSPSKRRLKVQEPPSASSVAKMISDFAKSIIACGSSERASLSRLSSRLASAATN